MHRFLAVALLLGCLCMLPASELTAPTEERWEPVRQVLEGGDDSQALSLLDRIVADFPRWDQGWLRRAEVLERQEQLQRALRDAQQAWELAPDADGHAATVARLHLRLGQYDQALAVQSRFAPRPDRQGWVHYYAAEAAFAQGNVAQSQELLDQAIRQAGRNVAADFRFLSGRIHEQQGDLAGAAAAFRRGLSDAPDHAQQWFNLGVVYRNLAVDGDEQALQQAAESFQQAVRLAGQDPYARFALGQTYLDLQDFVRAENNLMQALDRFQEQGVSQGTELATAHASFGLAHLRLAERGNPAGSYEKALSAFESAERLGLRDAPLYNNQLAAAIGAQRQASDPAAQASYAQRAEAIVQGPGAEYISPINLGLGYFHSAQRQRESDPLVAWREALLAAEMLGRASADAGPQQAAVLRFLGHAHVLAARMAEHMQKLVEVSQAGDADPEADTRAQEVAFVPQEDWQALATEYWDAAALAYQAAGDLRDGLAQRYFLAYESVRDPQRAYQAAWRFLAWRNYLSPQGWQVMLANYGAAEAYRSPISMAFWGLLLLLCLILGAKGFLFPKPLPTAAPRRERRAAAPAQAPAKRSAEQPATAGTKATPAQRSPGAGQRSPGTAPQRRALDDVAKRMAERSAAAAPPSPSSPPRRRR